MESQSKSFASPSEFYKLKRPEFFSDSKIIYEVQLTKEHLALELDQITINQKQDEFETLCRKLAEKLIAPNLIPQVGPTGGGDGKTDFETHPVSHQISDRWFVTQEGWKETEKWAFAISAKKTWKSKAKSDIINILSTKRPYTHIFFMTNQKPSSKKKKEAQDSFKEEYGIEVTILDGVWIIEKILQHNFIDLVVDALNLSKVYKEKKVILGANDDLREKQLRELEEKISTPNRYFEYDFQRVEDAIEAAIISRMLEKPRDEIEGKFLRAKRFCKKLNNPKQWQRIYYQRAWTYIHWFDDYEAFIEDYKQFKKHISLACNISSMELFFNFISLLRGLEVSDVCNLNELGISFKEEKAEFLESLSKFNDTNKIPCSTAIAHTYKNIQKLIDAKVDESSIYIKELSEVLVQGSKYLDYPFEYFTDIFTLIGNIFPNNEEFDNLTDIIAQITSKRQSDLASGEVFLNRGLQKIEAELFKESVVFFGKTIVKLAKKESNDLMYFALRGLAEAYYRLGLLWAANNCLTASLSLSFKSWYEKGVIHKRVYDCITALAKNELIIGRIPSYFSWHENLQIIRREINLDEIPAEKSPYNILDVFLAIKLLNTSNSENKYLARIPNLLDEKHLWLSQDACLYKLGYLERIKENFKSAGIKDMKQIDDYFRNLATQPAQKELLNPTNFLGDEIIYLSSIILGCEFKIKCINDKSLIITVEAFLAYFETFLATSLKNVVPATEEIYLHFKRNEDCEILTFSNKNKSNEYDIEIGHATFSMENRSKLWELMINLISDILGRNFFFDEIEKYLKNLFQKEEISERLSIVFEHITFTYNTLGESPKILLKDWIDIEKTENYSNKRSTPLNYKTDQNNSSSELNNQTLNNYGHNKRKAYSLIDVPLWDEAGWISFGIFQYQKGIGIALGFKDANYGKKIFDGWINKMGTTDKEEIIKICIIKGVNKAHPHWYKVLITSNMVKMNHPDTQIFTLTSRYREFFPNTSTNLDNLIMAYKHTKKYLLCPAETINNTGIKPFINYGIIKTELTIKNAWEIGIHDIEKVVINKKDIPIIPNNIKEPPILSILNLKE
ncbi:hypothetical protein [Aureispira anguillae]|uniref:Uncharacterized protein n=1 Tax=Aureispira anguillae TaxID=2864201 RepID=A0A916DQY3_9BACT|nr:hypothetical protein [Aureispira anguillae]BDS11469.1 hypothetical protein AsAng_0021830 [Aureispira anguillae]